MELGAITGNLKSYQPNHRSTIASCELGTKLPSLLFLSFKMYIENRKGYLDIN
jgi:hypothetical protein